MKKVNSLWVMFLLVLVWPLGAENEGKRAAVEQLFEVMQIKEQMAGGFDAMLPMVDQMSDKLALNAEDKEELIGIYRQWFDQAMDHDLINKKLVQIYSEAFSQEELEAYIVFYQTPAGRKLIEQMPLLMKAGSKMGFDQAQAKQHLLMEQLQPFFEKHFNKEK